MAVKATVGIGLPNGASDMTGALSFGFGSYLVIAGDHAPAQIAAIRERQPHAPIYLRRYGGIGGSVGDLVREMSALYDRYRNWGVRDLIAWNEADRAEEGGFSSQTIATFALDFFREMRRARPDARLHWPALAHLERYQGSEPGIWLPAARLYDVIDFHAYHDPGNARAFFQWISTFLPGKPIVCSEFNYGPGNARPASYGNWLYEVYRMAAQDFPDAEAVCPFIWRWEHPEPGIGTSLDIADDPDALTGIARAVADFSRESPAPEPPPPLGPLPEDWMARTNRDTYEPLARQIAIKYGVNPDIFARQIQQESGWDPNAVSPSGAAGLGQLMPQYYPHVALFDPESNLTAAAKSMHEYLAEWGGDYAKALASYNGGLSAVRRWGGAYGSEWRAALRRYPDQWPALAGYGTPAKAEEVARYLDAVIGPESATEEPMSEIVDLRGKLPTIGAYPKRPVSGILACTYHYTASDPGGTVKSIADYQTSQAAAGQTGTGRPFPGIAYTGIVKGDGVPHLCWDLDVATWHAPGWNETSIGLCYISNAAPTAKQIEGLARLHVYCEARLGRLLAVRGHKDDYATACPGGWPAWQAALVAEIQRQRAPSPVPPPANPDELWARAVRIGGEVRASGETVEYVAMPGNTEVTEQAALDECWRVAAIWQEKALELRDVILQLKGAER